MAILSYLDYELETYASGYMGWNVEVRDPFGAVAETLSRNLELEAQEAARAFVDRHIKENAVAVLRLEGDTNSQNIDEDDHTVWTYAATQPVYLFLDAVTELFINCSDGSQVGKTFQVQGTKGPGAAIPYEEISIDVALDGVDASDPVSLAAVPGAPTVEDIYDIRQIRPLAEADAIDPGGGGEIFIAAGFTGAGVPTGNVYGHIPTSTRGRNLSQLGVGTIPAGFESAFGEVFLGAHEDAAVWVEAVIPGQSRVDSFRFPMKSGATIIFDPPGGIGPPSAPARYPSGTRFSLMAHAKTVGGSNQTRVGGTIVMKLYRITA